MMLQFWKDVLPEGNILPTSHGEVKKFIKSLGLGYKNIHACQNDCILF